MDAKTRSKTVTQQARQSQTGSGTTGPLKYQTLIFPIDRQLWCTGCRQKFHHPVRLPCGHKFCGPESGRKCAEAVLTGGKCIVAMCGFELQRGLGDGNFKKLSNKEPSEYEKAFQLPKTEVQESASISEGKIECR